MHRGKNGIFVLPWYHMKASSKLVQEGHSFIVFIVQISPDTDLFNVS